MIIRASALLRSAALLATAVALAVTSPARAADDDFELWISPSVAVEIDRRTEVEIDTIARLRDANTGGADTYYVRGWVHRRVSSALMISIAAERRRSGSQHETRLSQQVSLRSGLFRARTRLEQRFVEGTPNVGWRLRQRAGLSVPLDRRGRWGAVIHAEALLTLEPTSPGGDTGLTGIRTYVGTEFEASNNMSLGLGYMRSRDIRSKREDRIAHAPVIEIALHF